MVSNQDYVLHRELAREYPLAERAEGAYIYDAAGRKYLDAAGSYFVVSLGHGVQGVINAITEQLKRLDFAHTGYFSSAAAQQFAERLIKLAPSGFSKVYFTTSGSASNDAAIKLARQYHLLSGNTEKWKVVARWHSYHGGSLGALSLTGHVRRREPFDPLLLPFPHISPAYCYRCPFGKEPKSCAIDCADELEATIRLIGPQYIAAFILEPISGGPLGAAVPHDAYLPRVREICDRYDVLLIADEIITGAGRTGAPLAVRHWNVTPDVVTLAKGIGGGLLPIGAVMVHERVYSRFESSGIAFRQGETFSGHPLVCAAGNAVLEQLESDNLFARAHQLGEELGTALEALRPLDIVGDVRGRGLLRGIEIVADKVTRRPFARRLGVAERIAKDCMECGVLVVPGTGCVDGVDGDTISLAPPFTIERAEIKLIVAALEGAIVTTARAIHMSEAPT
jgi:adenosylmethionine-8-amino-7-oxononanoate aminotransferase